ncbi:hypothetical protein AURDEDRAFT_149412 [Auricularia subglabra TFB-10046 SS5]|nr:hypothetical protein AURDEDRAFT_149412 [Auricularia subglabra TFB-10046 SS5]
MDIDTQDQRRPQLLDLPPELFERILTCKLLHAVVDASPLLQYHIELETAGLDEGAGCAAGIQERLKALRTHKKRWETLDWRAQTRAPFWDSGNIWDLYGGVFGQGNIGGRGRAFHFTRLPSKTLGLEDAHSWEFKNINVQSGVRDFSFEPALDLLVLLDMKSWPMTVHLRTLTTNEPHKDAARPVFEYMREGAREQAEEVEDESYYLQIMGDLVSILRLPRGARRIPLHRFNEIIVFNWRTGHLISSLMLPGLAMLTFSFVSPCHIVVGVGDDDQSENQRYPLPTNPRLQVYRFDPFAATPAPPELTSTLHLPALSESHRIGYLLTRSDPAPGTGVPPTRPFGASARDRLLVVTLTIRNRHNLALEEVLNIFVRMRTLLNAKGYLPWEAWAAHARAMPSRHEPTWVCYVHGMRFIFARDVAPDQGEQVRACVLDFNQLGLRKAKAELRKKTKEPVQTLKVVTIDEEEEDEAEELEVVDGEEDVDDGWEDDRNAEVRIVTVPSLHHSEVFERPIVSALPFRQFDSPVTLPCTALMLDEDNIVCVKEDDPRRLVFLTL